MQEKGPKQGSFGTLIKTLGLQIDLNNFARGEVQVGHTDSRRTEINVVLSDILKAGVISSKQAESIRGRLHWFESFAFGRVGNQAIKTLGSLVNCEMKSISISQSVKAALFFLKACCPTSEVSPCLSTMLGHFHRWCFRR